METTYKIIGGDGREYGPVGLAELKSWILDGRISGTTQIWRSDLGTWMPAGHLQELQPEIGTIAPPPLAAISATEGVGFWPRLGAYVIDQIVLYVFFLLVWSVVAKQMGWKTLNPSTIDPSDLGSLLGDILRNASVSLTLRLVYEVLLNGRFGATLGKMAIGAQIVQVDGSSIGYGRALGRSLASVLSEMICFIGYLFVAFRSDKRAMHDLLAGTRVVYR